MQIMKLLSLKLQIKLNHVTSGTLPIAVTDVMARPVITFDPEEIIYDEMDETRQFPVLLSKLFQKPV